MTEDKILNDYEKYPAKIVQRGTSKFVIVPYNIIKGHNLKVGDWVNIWIQCRKGDSDDNNSKSV